MLSRIYRSAVGLKALMAVSGIVLFGFVLVHMAGNLKMYLGPQAINHYAEWLREVGAPLFPPTTLLWVFRAVLLLSVIVHIAAAWKLTLVSRAARPRDYVDRRVVQTDYAARTVRWGGVIVLLFVLYHLADLTFGWVNPDFVPGDVYHNMVAGFSVWWVSAFYMVAQVALAFHLYHGLWSLFQSLGWSHPAINDWRRRFAATFAVVVAVGNLSFPLAVLSGLVS